MTTEVKDANNNIIVPAGKIVPHNFQVVYYNGTNTVTSNPVVSISNAQYETEQNALKQRIQVIRPELIEDFVATYHTFANKGKNTRTATSANDIKM